MEMHQHDSAQAFRFVLSGELAGDAVQQLEWAWETAKSILAGRDLIVDVSGIANADRSGGELLCRMRESGARLTAALPPVSGGFLRSLGVPVAAPTLRPGLFARLCGRRSGGAILELTGRETDDDGVTLPECAPNRQ
jgi:ABC-type transporter Mla MlaB component